METIIVATDFSPPADNATNYAAELARYFDAQLVLVHAYAIPATGADAGFSMGLIADWQKEAEKKLSEKKRILANGLGKGLQIDYVAEVGPVVDVVKTVSERYHADLIVMGIVSDAGKMHERIVGSSAVRVARSINVPTFIIPEKVKYRPIRKVSFACDMDSTEETQLVPVVKYFSRIFNADLEIVNVEEPEEEVSYEKAKANLFIENKLNAVKHRTVFITGSHIAKDLGTYFETHPTDLVMLNPKKHNIFYMLFNETVTNELAFHLHLPMLTIH